MYICAKVSQKSGCYGRCAVAGKEGKSTAGPIKKRKEMARDEGNRGEKSMCLTRVTATCAA